VAPQLTAYSERGASVRNSGPRPSNEDAQAAFEDFSGIFAWQAAADFDTAQHFAACEVLIP